MPQRRADLLGQTFGRLTVIAPAPKGRGDGARWLCQCTCGTRTTPTTNALRRGNSTSCGCLRTESMEPHRHHLSDTAEYRVWTLMRNRCSNPNAPNFHRYGGRGIAICPQWSDFRVFLRDMGTRPSADHSIDRIDNDGPYSPENCRWATTREQTVNRVTTHWIEHNGERMHVAEWARRAGIDKGTLNSRLLSGWTMADAMTKPVRHRASPQGPTACSC